MPDRIVRDELLTSERYWSVSIEAQRLFVHMLLVADDMARMSGKNFTIRSLCFPGQSVAPDKLEKLLEELIDADLVRAYFNDTRERFIFIPRFGQRLRYRNSRFPTPPSSINDLAEEKTDLGRSADRPKPAPSQSQDARREEKRSEEKKNNAAPLALPDWLPKEPWLAWIESRKKLRKPPTEYAQRLAINTLAKLRDQGHDVGEVINASVMGGWSGFFAPDKKAAKANPWDGVR